MQLIRDNAWKPQSFKPQRNSSPFAFRSPTVGGIHRSISMRLPRDINSMSCNLFQCAHFRKTATVRQAINATV